MDTGKKKQNTGKRRNPQDPPKEKRFKPGQSGNPKGKPKIPEEEKSIIEYLQTANAQVVKDLIKSKEYPKLLRAGLKRAIKMGKFEGFKFLNDYNGNKPTEKVEHSGDQDKPIIITTKNFG